MIQLQNGVSAQQAYDKAYQRYHKAPHTSAQHDHLNMDARAGEAQTQLIAALYNEVSALRQDVGRVLDHRL